MIIEDNSRRCSNCYRYPFCTRCNTPKGFCEGWQSKCMVKMEEELKEVLKKGKENNGS